MHIEGFFQHFCLPRDCSYSWGSSVGEESVCNAGNPSLVPVRKIHWRRDRLPTPVFFGFPGGSAGKESLCNDGDLGSTPVLGRSPGEGIGYPLQYSWASLVAQLVKNLPETRETLVLALYLSGQTWGTSLSFHFFYKTSSQSYRKEQISSHRAVPSESSPVLCGHVGWSLCLNVERPAQIQSDD